ncbi:15-hydroxyprostaglandin dehydrogenase [Penicillium malachiteum]|uniref:15-hydroxyprostaglandin dehydrogenase n=1 Tax=Penicillium malachiteum TaxID=1324776 RepID=UPI0025497E49|nr:15-hydroxyprostaglandin dehydrogenase [Penicillium malachiteum]KAJ5730569.1 15-hydroxyprostaglandin dehydrogenase [Penicillium malachiteum]
MASGIEALKGQSAIVTGGGSGINLAFTKLLVDVGVNFLIADLSLHSSAQTWIKLHETTNGSHGRAFGKGASIVVPGAGVFDHSTNSFWEDYDTDYRYKILDVNLAHTIKMTRLAIARWLDDRKRNGASSGICGTVVHISSISGQVPSLATPLYVASKHGINGFVRSMGPLQQACGIRVVGVAPGLTETPLLVDHPLTFSIYDPRTDMILPPEELARAMMALVVETEKYQAGTILEVCDTEGRWCEVSVFNDPGPQGPASKMSGGKAVIDDLWKSLGLKAKI